MFVVCWLLVFVVFCCSLIVVGCLLSVVRCLLFVICRMSFVACLFYCGTFAVVVCYLLVVVC